MTFIEAIKKAYEKACDLKREENGDYIYYSTICRKGFDFNEIEVQDDGKVELDYKDITVDDLTADDWELEE